jgi:hypothetical protein
VSIRKIVFAAVFILLGSVAVQAHQHPDGPNPEHRVPTQGDTPGVIALLPAGLVALWIARTRARAKKSTS